jgi:hypothetical protein
MSVVFRVHSSEDWYFEVGSYSKLSLIQGLSFRVGSFTVQSFEIQSVNRLFPESVPVA